MIPEKRQIEILNRKVEVMNKSFASQIRKLTAENVDLRLQNDPTTNKTFHIIIAVTQVLAMIVVVGVAMFVVNS